MDKMIICSNDLYETKFLFENGIFSIQVIYPEEPDEIRGVWLTSEEATFFINFVMSNIVNKGA